MKQPTEGSIKHALRKYFGEAEIKSFKHLKQGAENMSIFVDTGEKHLLLRYWGELHSHIGTRNESDVLGELRLMMLFYDNNLPIPKIYTTLDGDLYARDNYGQPYMLMDFVRGEQPRDFSADMVRQVGQAMGKMHVLVHDFDYPHSRAWPGSLIEMAINRSKIYMEKYGSEMSEVHDLTRKYIREFEQAAAKVDFSDIPRGVIHGDIMDENIKFDSGKLSGIFDFDDYRISYFIEDIAKSLMFKFDNPHESMFGADGRNVAEFIDAYETERPLTSKEKMMQPLFYQARFLFNIFRYFRKADEGKTGYLERIPASFERYKRFEKFFNP